MPPRRLSRLVDVAVVLACVAIFAGAIAFAWWG